MIVEKNGSQERIPLKTMGLTELKKTLLLRFPAGAFKHNGEGEVPFSFLA
jgi:hypothetical protein